MKTKRTGHLHQPIKNAEFFNLTERHLGEWLAIMDQLLDTHAPTDEVAYCRNKVTRLQLELYQLRKSSQLTTPKSIGLPIRANGGMLQEF